MKKTILLNYDWKFRKESDLILCQNEDYFDMFKSNSKTGTTSDVRGNSIYDDDWERVDLPHDWNITAPAREDLNQPTHGHRPQEVVWYRKQFTLGEEYENKRLFLRFDAIAILSEIWFNSIKVAQSESGYTPIIVEITDFVEFGKQNILSVKADNTQKEGWWYEGGGIYGDVTLIVTEQSYIKPFGVFVKPTTDNLSDWTINIEAEMELSDDCDITFEIPELSLKQTKKAEEKTCVTFNAKNPLLWNADTPNLYKANVTLTRNGEVIDEKSVRFGFRKIDIDSEKGCFINGENVKLNGVCIHHDFACIGVAVTKEVQRYRIKRLKEMGCNAIRTSHNPQLEDFYELCDEQGILVMDEVRHFSSTEECLKQLEIFIKRDRNHPSVIMWSIFNEEPLQCTKTGEKIARTMKALVNKLDGTRPVCGGMNGPMEHEGVKKVVDIMGFNYIQYAYDKFHKLHPEIPLIGSENSSHLMTRGITKTDMSKVHLSCIEDVFNENLYAWSATVGDTWRYINERDFVMGGFDWTGFDYRGECREFPAAVCNFGAMDLCAFPKDSYYWHKVIWEDESQIYLSPNKRYEIGERYKFACYSNCDRVVVKQNGEILFDGKHNKYDRILIEATYCNDDIEAYGYKDGEIAATFIQHKCFEPEKIVLSPQNTAYSNDVCIINISAVDINGNVVENANDLIKLYVSGGKILGVGNGDNCFNGDETLPEFNLFNGLGQTIIRPEKGADKIVLTAESSTLNMAKVEIEVVSRNEQEAIESEKAKIQINSWRQSDVLDEYIADEYISDLMFAWSPTTIGYGTNINFSGQVGYAEVCGQISSLEKGKEACLVIENLLGKGDIYFDKDKVAEFDNSKNLELKIDSEKYASPVISFVFKLNGGDCGILGDVYLMYK